jgi:hypothetical protein
MSFTRFAVSFLLTSMVYLSPAIAAEALPAEVKQGSVRYVTGGIGADAVEAFKQAAAKYPLELLFAQKALPNDVYLAGVKVTVRQAGKVLLETESDGPFLLAHLPSGKYQIEAVSEGVTRQQTVDVQAGKHRRVVFLWSDPAGAN